ncbi:glutathione S-transferase [Pseudomonas petrae]|uniref:Glutathione S-transferase n=1 Tax=Pseudomonas petrae TaxID=2912190 RepID=A0ABS9I4W6_9PSED|nr:glutathione S-transferase [Pseudomonas petrae]MCF7532323.1 glutathione S-transferase [Pseudomonas petrae]MCF7535956.1 glutathione S-transferase [Pseudomonas petrae]MCF7542817.1 glutathione S-transferase [Pseudomonas petrae]
MFTLFGADGSGSAATEMALTLCGAEYRLVAASSWDAGAGQDELKRLNPLLQVPTLVIPGGGVMTESAAILTHLGLAFPLSGLLSQDALERAQQLRALAYLTSNCYASIGLIDYPERWLPDADPDQLDRLVAGARSKLHSQWEVFSDVFYNSVAWHPHAPGAVEILACVVSQWSGAREHLGRSRPEFYASLGVIDGHPVINAVLQRHGG